ncbi:MAG: hypothetical protein ACI8S6_000449 [Myxococcota bacterium]|jgi:hypothetical protein
MIRLLPLLVMTVACDEVTTDGSGYVLAEVREVEAFSGVVTDGINARVSVGGMQRVQLISDDNILPSVQAEVVDGVLMISMAPGDWSPTSLSVDVSVPALGFVGNHGGADLSVVGIAAEVLEVSASGIGHTELSGVVSDLIIDSSGSGTRNGQDLRAASVTVTATSDGTLWLTADDAIEGAIDGEATLNVFGDPKIRDVDSTGLGSVAYY